MQQTGNSAKSTNTNNELSPENGFHNMDCRWLMDRNTAGSKMSMLGFTIFCPGGQHDPHIHDNAEEYMITVRGHGSTLIGHKWYKMKPGQAVFIPRGAVHSTRNTSKKKNLEIFFFNAGAATLGESGYRLLRPNVPQSKTSSHVSHRKLISRTSI
jgi:mannose-6-phosphate isomerase-like protein (cupin superfamily)